MSTQLAYTPIDEIPRIHADLRKSFRAGTLKSIEARRTQILQLAYLLQTTYDRFKTTFAQDLGRPSLEVAFLELDSTIGDCKIAYDRVDKWARTEKPKGVVLSISPFNYPVWLALGPMIGAIAAGNCFVLKPSELSPATSGLIAELIPKYMDPDVVRVVMGAVPETTKLLELPWDHILYTGNGRVARIVCAAAAKTLSPVSLELGGKSPVVIDPNVISKPRRNVSCGANTTSSIRMVPTASPDFCHIINQMHFNRVRGLLEKTSGTTVVGGQTDEARLFVAPTVVKGVKGDDSLMSEELFGPVLPVVPVKDVDEAIEFINDRDHPLALYVFSQDSSFKNKAIFDNTRSGTAIANDTLIHCATDGLPFGGIGPSGSGYHARKFTFDMFTHLRASLDSPSWIDIILGSRFPPYNASPLL
ncbi:NAD-dependent aldehyde dehydrogenase [Boletus reticuloceps]|uniref:Aldehyde dehydrogenase n=1 Tax=Boletus reticuloceps TaxID=495285 RepID=A0A8I2YSJ7_9AGAM|nr:NAD-dependent aldehyde dehydrogenase [Boletus reticuloceps]